MKVLLRKYHVFYMKMAHIKQLARVKREFRFELYGD